MKKSFPVECSSSHFSCIVADTFDFFVLQLSNEAAIVPKLLSKSNCGNKRRATVLSGLAGGYREKCQDKGWRRQEAR